MTKAHDNMFFFAQMQGMSHYHKVIVRRAYCMDTECMDTEYII